MRWYAGCTMISFVIPAHNEEDIIVATLTHIRGVAGKYPHEIILSDDGSTDSTREKARVLTDRVIQYNGEMPKTIGATRNRGARAAAGDILFFLDSDVRLRDPEHFMSRVVESFESDPKLDAMTVSIRVYPEAETWGDILILTCFDLYFRLLNNVFGFGGTHGKCMIVRTSSFRRVGGFNEHMPASEDADLFIRLSKTGMTMLDPSLRAYFSGRRAHAIGWPRLLWRWTLNGVWIVLFKRSYSRHWNREGISANVK